MDLRFKIISAMGYIVGTISRQISGDLKRITVNYAKCEAAMLKSVLF